MANRKISQFTELTAPATTDVLPIIDQSGTGTEKNKKITYANLLTKAPNGSASLPSFSFLSDPNSGISGGFDTLTLSTNGLGRLVANDSGLITIPGTLTVTGTSTFSDDIDLASTKVLKINGTEVLSATAYTGNAATATVLATARTIGGVSFNGSANIDLPGVNTAGNQNTTGSAATLTTPRTIGGVSFDGSANINLPGVNTAGNQNTTGSAATLTTARNIGGVSFDGSANIDLPGVNAVGNQNTTGSAATLTTARTIAGVSFNGSANISLNNNAITNGASYVTASIINSLDASNLSSGTIPDARFPATLPAVSGVNLTSLNASNLGSGTVAAARLSTATTQTAGNSTTKIATTAFVSTAVSNLINGAPAALDTLNELAAAMADDAAFSTTVTNNLATKLNLAGGQMTGNLTFSGSQTVDGRDLSVDGSKLDGIEAGAKDDQTAADIKTLFNSSGLVNAQIDASAAIAGSKISPNFGSQDITTTGELQCKDMSLIDTTPKITFFDSDNNPDFTLSANSGSFRITDSTNSAERLVVNSDGHVDVLGNLDVGAGLDVTGDISVTGTVDGRDVATDGTKLDGIETGATADQTKSDIDALGIAASTAATLATARSINGVSFNGSADITVTAAGSTLTGTSLKSTIVSSSLTSVGTLTGLTVSGDILMSGTGAIDVAAGTTAQRPGSPNTGMFRYNSTSNQFEGYTNAGWGAIAGGGGASGATLQATNGIVETAATISSNHTVTTNFNAMSAGPVTVSADVTIPSGSVWTIV